MKGNAVKGYRENIVDGAVGAGSCKYEAVIFDAYKYDTDSETDDSITSYYMLKMESRRIFYSKFFNIMKSCYRY
jgi:hypothetical protein